MTSDERQAAADRIRVGIADRPPTWWWRMQGDAVLEMLDDALMQADEHQAGCGECRYTASGRCPDAARADAQIARLDRLWSA